MLHLYSFMGTMTPALQMRQWRVGKRSRNSLAKARMEARLARSKRMVTYGTIVKY